MRKNNNNKKTQALSSIEVRLNFMIDHDLISEKDAIALMDYITILISDIKEENEKPEGYSDAIKIWEELKKAREEYHYGDGDSENDWGKP